MKNKLTRTDKIIISSYLAERGIGDDTLLDTIRKTVVMESGKFRKDKYSDLDENEQYKEFLYKAIDKAIGKV